MNPRNQPPFNNGNNESGEAMEMEVMSTQGDAGLELERMNLDVQICTAKKYSRIISVFRKDAETMVSASVEVAEGCTYSLKRKAADGSTKVIEGPSIRLAEIVSTCWGNIMSGARILEIGDRFIKAQGACFDMERNVRTTTEVFRRITTKNGQRFGDDMIGVTANAAMAIAKRNAINGVIPRVYIQELMKKAQGVAVGNQVTLPERRKKSIAYFEGIGVKKEILFAWLEVKDESDMTVEHIKALIGLKTALETSETTMEAEFGHLQTAAEIRRGRPTAPAQTAAAAPVTPVQQPEPPKPTTPAGETAQNAPETAQSAPAEASNTPETGEVTPPPAESLKKAAGSPAVDLFQKPAAASVHHAALEKYLDQAKLSPGTFLAWAKSQRLCPADASSIEQVPAKKVSMVLANWTSMVDVIAKHQG